MGAAFCCRGEPPPARKSPPPPPPPPAAAAAPSENRYEPRREEEHLALEPQSEPRDRTSTATVAGAAETNSPAENTSSFPASGGEAPPPVDGAGPLPGLLNSSNRSNTSPADSHSSARPSTDLSQEVALSLMDVSPTSPPNSRSNQNGPSFERALAAASSDSVENRVRSRGRCSSSSSSSSTTTTSASASASKKSRRSTNSSASRQQRTGENDSFHAELPGQVDSDPGSLFSSRCSSSRSKAQRSAEGVLPERFEARSSNDNLSSPLDSDQFLDWSKLSRCSSFSGLGGDETPPESLLDAATFNASRRAEQLRRARARLPPEEPQQQYPPREAIPDDGSTPTSFGDSPRTHHEAIHALCHDEPTPSISWESLGGNC